MSKVPRWPFELCALMALVLVFAFASRHAPMVAAAPPAPAAALTWPRTGATIATFDANELTLTVTEHAPRALLVCLRGECRLVEEWVGK